MSTKKIRVLMCPANGEPYLTNMENALKLMQEAVGGYIETVTLMTRPKVVLVCNEEGLIKRLPFNRSLPDPQLLGLSGWNIVGDCFLCGTRGSEFTDLPESLRTQLLRSAREAYEESRT